MSLSQRWLPWRLSLLACQWILGHYASAAYFMMPFRIFEFSIGVLWYSPHTEITYTGCIRHQGRGRSGHATLLNDSNTTFLKFCPLLPSLETAACIHSGFSGAVLHMKPQVPIDMISYTG